MSITPVSPTSPTSGSSTPSTGFTPSLLGAVDNQSTYSNDIAGGNRMTIIGFSSAIISATNNANETAFSVQQSNATMREDMYFAFIQNSLDLVKTYQAFLAIANKYSTSYTTNNADVAALNVQLLSYNSAAPNDIAAVNAVNTAITGYNNGSVTPAQLQTAYTTYNAYATSHNTLATLTNTAITTFNTKVTGTNHDVDEVNDQLGDKGVAKLDKQKPYTPNPTNMPLLGTAPTTTAPPSLSLVSYTPVTLAPAINTMSPSGGGDPAQLASALFAPYAALMTGQYAATAKAVSVQAEYQELVQTTLTGTPPFIPPSFYQPTPKLGSGGATGGSGAGVSSAGLVMTLSNPLMSAVIQQNMFASNSLEIINQIQLLGSQLLSQVELQAGASALAILGDKIAGIDLNSPAAAAAVALALASEINGVISSGAFAEGIQSILSQYGITGEVSAQIIAAAELNLLQLSLLQLGQALGTPQLFGQVVSTSVNAQATALFSAQVSASIVLDDATQREILIKDVANRTRISQDILRQAINEANVNGEVNGQTLQEILVQNGIDPNDANSAEVILRSSLQAEIIGYGVLEKRVSADQLNSSRLSNELVNSIVKNQPDITNRQLRDELSTQFVANGATQSQALDLASQIVVGSSATGVPVAPVSTQALITALNANASVVSAALGLNPSEAQAFANQLVSTVLGSNVAGSQTSISALIDSRVLTLIKTQDANVTSKLQDNFLQFQGRTLELSEFADDMRDPANLFVFVAEMYKRPQPTNFLKNVDISV